jgi:hypothetical protein
MEQEDHCREMSEMWSIGDTQSIPTILDNSESKQHMENMDQKQCSGTTWNGKRCRRKRRKGFDTCCIHTSIEHTLSSKQMNTINMIDVHIEDIQGILYYVDNFENVYCTEDILAKKQNPKIVGRKVSSHTITFCFDDTT